MIPVRGCSNWHPKKRNTLRLAQNIRGQSCFASADSGTSRGTSISNEEDDWPSATIQRLITADSDDHRAASNRRSKNPRYNFANARSQARKASTRVSKPSRSVSGRSAGSGRRTALGANRTPSKISVQCSSPDAIINPAFRGHLPFLSPRRASGERAGVSERSP